MFARGCSRPWLGLLLLTTAIACGSGEAHDDPAKQAVCAPIAPTACPDPAPQYADVAPIFEQRCSSCHNDMPGGEWPLDTYEHVVDWGSVVRDELLRCSMPPADSGVSMTSDERQQILAWVRCRYPRTLSE